MGTRLDPRNFHRKAVGTGRPAALYRLAPPQVRRPAGASDAVGPDDETAAAPAVLNPPLMRPAA